jgi:hypothetical protein
MSCNRLPSHIYLWDGWGEGFGAWGLACCHDRRGAGVGSGPVASLPHVEPSRCPAGVGSGDTSVALELAPATHVGGQRPAPTGRMPGESPATAMHWLELAPHVWRLRAETPGNGEHTKIQQKRKVVPDRRSSRLSPAGGVISSCRGLWVLGLPGKPWLK